MATEEPQSLPMDNKPASPTPIEEMAVDQPTTKSVNGNGHVMPDEDRAKSSDTPTLNGDKKPVDPTSVSAKESLNHQAFAANSDLPDENASKPIEPSHETDAEMTDVNGVAKDSKEEHQEQPAESIQTDTAVPAADDAPALDASNSDKAKPAEPEVESAADSMDVDASTERPDLLSSAEHANSTQDTSAVSDAPDATSPQDPSQQPADLSKLEIQTTQEDAASSQPDATMADPPASPAKIPREREEDDAEAPAAKRAKTVENSDKVEESLVVKSGLPSAPQPSGDAVDSQVPDDQPITNFQNRQIRQYLGTVKKTKAGANFRQSVEKLWPALWNDYRAKIDKPVDIAFFEDKLRKETYKTYGDFKADVRQLHENALIFNGPNHDVTNAAASVRDNIFQRMPELAQMEEPSKTDKGKAHPTRHAEPRAATQPRRQSQSQQQDVPSASKPKPQPAASTTPTSGSGPSFALPPSGVPQIRRDSTRDDKDRPKRPIHPPKNRDLDYGSQSSRKKKLEPEQQFIHTVLEKAKSPRYIAVNGWFLAPVDPVALNIPQYFKIIKKPMDLGSMTQKLQQGEYKVVKDMEKDVKQIVLNAETFNGPEHEVSKQARELEKLFKELTSEKDKWMERHYPPEAPAAQGADSPERSDAESEEESEGEADGEETSEVLRSLQARLGEEQSKLNTLLGAKKPDMSMIEIQQSMISHLQRKLVEEKTKLASEKKPGKKKKSGHSKSKSKSGGMGSAGGSGNKKSANHASNSKKAAGSNKKSGTKKRVIGPVEKALIAEGINELDGNTLTKAVEIIKRDTGQNENDDGEMELDIDSLTTEALGKLYDLIYKAHPSLRAAAEQQVEARTGSASSESKSKSGGAPKPKKNKPMNKHEQERKIEQLRELKAQLARHGSGSQEPVPGEAEEQPAAESESEESDSEEE
ncbi:Bromodomain-containing protein [Xylariaceae sp. FL0016]|nr:Bromodomain-containing protein [Xylariaceae sp. FL0016]